MAGKKEDKPKFKEIVFTESRYCLNWIGIRREIISFAKFIRYSIPPIKQKIKEQQNISFKEKYGFNDLWEKYCNWWNNKFNNGGK